MSTSKPIEDIWGDGKPEKPNGMAYFRCKNHPERIGVVDLGIDAPNRYPCRQCYKIILQNRLKK